MRNEGGGAQNLEASRNRKGLVARPWGLGNIEFMRG